MKYRYSDDSIGTTAFYDDELMGGVYERGTQLQVYRDDDGVPWFEVRQECSEAFDADDRFERYGESTDTDMTDGESDE